MKFECTRNSIKIIPENDQDVAYIEDTLGLKNDGEWLCLMRNDAHGVSHIANLEAKLEHFPNKPWAADCKSTIENEEPPKALVDLFRDRGTHGEATIGTGGTP